MTKIILLLIKTKIWDMDGNEDEDGERVEEKYFSLLHLNVVSMSCI